MDNNHFTLLFIFYLYYKRRYYLLCPIPLKKGFNFKKKNDEGGQ